MIDRLRLGATGLAVSPICLGMVGEAGAVLEAFDRGVNFFFLSGDLHYPLYEPLRKGLTELFARGGAVRDAVVVCGVSYVAQPGFMRGPFEELLVAVPGLERLDIGVAGGVYGIDAAHRLAQLDHVANRLGLRGRGVSFHDRAAALRCVAEESHDVVFVRYNPMHPGAQSDLFPFVGGRARARLFNFKSLGGRPSAAQLPLLHLDEDVWIPRATDYYRYALTRPELDGLLCAPHNSDEIAQLDAALALGGLSPDEEEHLVALADELRERGL